MQTSKYNSESALRLSKSRRWGIRPSLMTYIVCSTLIPIAPHEFILWMWYEQLGSIIELEFSITLPMVQDTV